MSIITECDNCGQQEKFTPGSHGVPYGHEGAIQWMTGGESRPLMLVMTYTCKDCRKASERAADKAKADALAHRRKQPS